MNSIDKKRTAFTNEDLEKLDFMYNVKNLELNEICETLHRPFDTIKLKLEYLNDKKTKLKAEEPKVFNKETNAKFLKISKKYHVQFFGSFIQDPSNLMNSDEITPKNKVLLWNATHRLGKGAIICFDKNQISFYFDAPDECHFIPNLQINKLEFFSLDNIQNIEILLLKQRRQHKFDIIWLFETNSELSENFKKKFKSKFNVVTVIDENVKTKINIYLTYFRSFVNLYSCCEKNEADSNKLIDFLTVIIELNKKGNHDNVFNDILKRIQYPYLTNAALDLLRPIDSISFLWCFDSWSLSASMVEFYNLINSNTNSTMKKHDYDESRFSKELEHMAK